MNKIISTLQFQTVLRMECIMKRERSGEKRTVYHVHVMEKISTAVPSRFACSSLFFFRYYMSSNKYRNHVTSTEEKENACANVLLY